MKQKIIKNTAFLYLLLFSISVYSQVRISEVSGDSGNNDAENDGIVELSGSAGTDIGCHVISNSEWVVVLPAGTTIPSNGHFVIACGQAQISNNPSPQSGLTCSKCDFEGLNLNFDVCSPQNNQYVDFASSGFTLDNANPDDGDQVVLFAPNGAILDAVQWGGGSRFLANDNTTLAGNHAGSTGRGGGNQTYTLGNLTWNGEGDIAVLPAAIRVGGVCFQTGINYIMPPISSGQYCDLTPLATTKSVNADVLKGCNSTFQRIGTGCSSSSWRKSDHPNPGFPNDTSYEIFNVVGNTTQCAGATSPITFRWQILNWQHVENQDPSTFYGKIGSFISKDGGITRLSWNSIVKDLNTGITTLTYTFTPNIDETYTLAWKDYTGSEIASSDNGSTSGAAITKNTTPSDCYETRTVYVKVVQPLIANKTNVECPADFARGVVNIANVVSGGENRTYQLNDGINLVETNSTGLFLLPTSLTDPLSVRVSDESGCNTPLVININNNCRQNPICPSNITTINSTVSGNACPNQVIDLCVNGTDLPNGGIIEWYASTTASFNPYNNEGVLVGTAQIPISQGTEGHPDGGTCPVITGLMVDACNGTGIESDNEFIVLRNGGVALNVNDLAFDLPNNSDITSSNNNDFSVNNGTTPIGGCYTTLDDGMTIPANALVILFTSNNVTQAYNFSSLCTAYGNVYLLFKNQAPVSGTFTNTNGATRSVALTVAGRVACSATYTYTNSMATIDGTFYNMPLPITGLSSTSVSSNNGCASPPVAVTNPPCINYKIPESACNTIQYFKAVIKPLSSSCSQNNASSSNLAYTVTCPKAVLSGGAIACSPSVVPLTITMTDFVGTPTFTIKYTINGIEQAPINTTNSTYILNAFTTGEYQLKEVVVSGNCGAIVSGVSNIEILPTSQVDLINEVVTSCPNEIAILHLTSVGQFPMLLTYSVNGLNKTATLTSNKFYMPTNDLTAGIYQINLISLTNENGCTGIVGTTTAQITILPKPTFDVETIPVTCNGNTPNIDGKIILKNFQIGDRYAYVAGNSYIGTITYATASPISNDGIIINNLVNPINPAYYTVRVFNSNNCFEDKIVILSNKVCNCVTPVCLDTIHLRIR